jgi:membrane protein implicated in regulation of membrane protease activity
MKILVIINIFEETLGPLWFMVILFSALVLLIVILFRPWQKNKKLKPPKNERN